LELASAHPKILKPGTEGDAASGALAKGARGQVPVFLDLDKYRIQSTWARIELPGLEANEHVWGVVYHLILPDGSVVILPAL